MVRGGGAREEDGREGGVGGPYLREGPGSGGQE